MGACMGTENVKQEEAYGEISLRKNEMIRYKNRSAEDIYHIKKEIAEGSNGQVWLAVHKVTGQERAMKIVSKKKFSSQSRQESLREVAALKELSHPNIIRVTDLYEDANHLYMVTELCTGGELYSDLIKKGRYTEKDTIDLIRKLLSAVAYCHSKGIVHRDIVPQNILLSSKDPSAMPKLIDFGLASIVADTEQSITSQVTSFYYSAPEVFTGSYNAKCDIWAVGIICYQLLCGKLPFTGSSNYAVKKTVMNEEVNFSSPAWKQVSEEGRKFVKQLLEKRASNRPDAKEALADPWLAVSDEEIEKNAPALQNALQSLRSYQKNSLLQRSAMKYIALNVINQNQEKEMADQFQLIDTDKDGKITREELNEGMEKWSNGRPMNSVEADLIFNAVDTDNDGTIDFHEFVSHMVAHRETMSEAMLQTTFQLLNEDQDSGIDKEELQNIFGVAATKNPKLLDSIMGQVDQNKDGKIGYNEFKSAMLKGVGTSLA